MGLTVKALHIGDMAQDWAFLLSRFNNGRKTFVSVISYLILGAEAPILVDTGFGDPSFFPPIMRAFRSPDQDLMNRLRDEGLEPGDIGYIIETHLDPDHTGKTHAFPNAKIILQRKEIAFHAAYWSKLGNSPDLPWFVSNLDRIEFIDGDMELWSGIKCVLAPGHTEGHQHVEVQTDRGKAVLVGDTVYDMPMQLEERGGPGIMWSPGQCWNQALIQDQLYRLRWELKRGAMILPAHTYEPFDRYGLGKRLSDMRTSYEGYPTLDWPPIE